MRRVFNTSIALKGSALAALLFLAVGTANATTLNLTTTGAAGTVNGAYFVQIDPQSTGTGVINSFVQVSGAGNLNVTEAYNTTVNNTLNNGSSAEFNHSITLGSVPIVSNPFGQAGNYYEFLLDINENNNAALDQFLSLDEIQVFWGGAANPSSTTFSGGVLQLAGATLAYRLDAGSDSLIGLNYALNAGSGSGDMFMYIPVSAFAGATSSSVVTLYSHFGSAGLNPAGLPAGNYATSDGFEEWATRIATPTTVPEPASLPLVLLGLTGIGSFAWMRARK